MSLRRKRHLPVPSIYSNEALPQSTFQASMNGNVRKCSSHFKIFIKITFLTYFCYYCVGQSQAGYTVFPPFKVHRAGRLTYFQARATTACNTTLTPSSVLRNSTLHHGILSGGRWEWLDPSITQEILVTKSRSSSQAKMVQLREGNRPQKTWLCFYSHYREWSRARVMHLHV